MNRRTLLLSGAAAFGALSLSQMGVAMAAHDLKTATFTPLEKTDDQWRDLLSDESYQVLRKEGTERAGTSELNQEKRSGTFICAGCYLPLFESNWKYESGTGWPSFFDVLQEHIGTTVDRKFFMSRTEYHCKRCGGHQGHVFTDGPKPTGLRYCNNGVAIKFVAAEQPLPELRS